MRWGCILAMLSDFLIRDMIGATVLVMNNYNKAQRSEHV